MKTAPDFDQVVGASHQVDTKVELRAPDGTLVADLPVEAGTVTGSAAAQLSRWSGDITLAGLEWAPDGADHPLSGMSGHYCSIQRAAMPYGSAPTWVEVARLFVASTEVTMSRSEAVLRVRLMSPGDYLARALTKWVPAAGKTAQDVIEDIARAYLPQGWPLTVIDSTTAAQVPADYESRWEPALTTMDTMAAVNNARTYFDATGRLVIRPTLLSLDVATLTGGRQLAVDVDVIRYTLTFGRDIFANHVVTEYSWEDSNGDQQERRGLATIATGPLRTSPSPAGRLSTFVSVDREASQAAADAYAAAVLTAQSQAWVTSRIDAVQDPRIEPDDIVETTYLDRTLRHRVVGVQFDLRTDAMQLTGRTALPAGGP